jgi:uncharacterized protein (DUF924 family)
VKSYHLIHDAAKSISSHGGHDDDGDHMNHDEHRSHLGFRSIADVAAAAGDATLARAIDVMGTLSPPRQQACVPPDALEVARFWRSAGPRLWFAKDPGFDRTFRESFLDLHDAARRNALPHWPHTPEGALAHVLLLDQFPRNAFRDSPRMYATDQHAQAVADDAIRVGHDRKVEDDMALFFYLPFAHSERLEDQERAVELVRRLGEPSIKNSYRHRDIIKRFGRFPHRNPILGRATTLEEQRFLDEGGYAG